ncbi:hypothetical protein [Spirillospora sp. NPDC047279]|uniref:hypothetical protein n=1 Tax=Spirillospora sp. NPDC047279 TaxID=3155478 RepID=UPI00340F9B34
MNGSAAEPQNHPEDETGWFDLISPTDEIWGLVVVALVVLLVVLCAGLLTHLARRRARG